LGFRNGYLENDLKKDLPTGGKKTDKKQHNTEGGIPGKCISWILDSAGGMGDPMKNCYYCTQGDACRGSKEGEAVMVKGTGGTGKEAKYRGLMVQDAKKAIKGMTLVKRYFSRKKTKKQSHDSRKKGRGGKLESTLSKAKKRCRWVS